MEKRFFVHNNKLGRYANENGEFKAYKRTHAEAKVFETAEAAQSFIDSKSLVDASVRAHHVTVAALANRRPMP